MNMHDRWEEISYKQSDEYLKFEKIENPPCLRPDLCAMLYLDKKWPGKRDIVSGASHDQIWLDVNMEEFESTATDEDIRYLSRCGVSFDCDTESLFMFV